MMGWQCPGCGSCFAPHVRQCEYCLPRTYCTSTVRVDWRAVCQACQRVTSGDCGAHGPRIFIAPTQPGEAG